MNVKDLKSALESGAIEILLVSEELKQYTHNFKCNKCSHEFTLQHKEKDPDGIQCPKCQADSLEQVDVKDFVEDLSERATEFGSDLELVSGDSEEGDMLIKAFGGIAAILRYRL